MPKVVYIEHDGIHHILEVPRGTTLMAAAVVNKVPAIMAACGGDGGCATCHVYVDARWTGRIGAPSARERSTLRFAFEPQANSRLACQIVMTEELDGLVLRVPSRQY